MKRLIELQEKNEGLLKEQGTIMARAQEMIDGKERGLSDTDATRFDSIDTERKALAIDIEREKKFEQVRADEALIRKPIEAPHIATKEQPYSLEKAFTAAVNGDWSKAGKEKEAQQELGRSGKGFSENRLIIDPNMSTRANSAGTATAGAELVGTMLQPDKFIDVLWNSNFMAKLGLRENLGLVGNYSVPVSTTKTTATMVGEASSGPSASDLVTALKTASPKLMMTKATFSRQLAVQSTPNIRGILQTHVINAINEKLCEMFAGGTGSSPILQGIISGLTGTVTPITGAYSGTPSGATGGAPTYALIVNLLLELGKANVGGDLKFLTNMQVVSKLMTTLKDSANTNSGYIMNDQTSSLLGFPVIHSQAVQATYAKSSSGNILSPLILGNFSETEVYQWDNIVLEFDTITAADTAQVVLRSYSFWDYLHLRPANYAVLNHLITT